MLAAPGIWHRQEVDDSYLEKDVEIEWQRPFKAVWKTQLFDNGEYETAYPFRDKRGGAHRPSIGSYVWPVWFDGDKAFFHLSKKVPPVGAVLIYALEGHKHTPREFATTYVGDIPSLRKPVDLQWAPRRTGVCACNGRDCVERVFRAGLQTREVRFLQEVFDDFDAENSVFGSRLVVYHAFIEKMKAKIDSWNEAENRAQVRTFLDTMAEGIMNVEKEYRETMGERMAPELLAYEAEGIRKLRELSQEEGPEVYPEVKYLLLNTNGTTDNIEKVSAGIGGHVIKGWSFQVARSCMFSPEAVQFAEEIRRDITELLGHGETWESVY